MLPAETLMTGRCPIDLSGKSSFWNSNPHVSVVTSLPRPVDERVEATNAFNDFGKPLAFPDFSRRTWLRHFFFESNCLCAPSTMIRRKAYEVA